MVCYAVTALSVNISFLRLKGDLEEREERLEKTYERDLLASSYGIITIIMETVKLCNHYNLF